MHKAWTRIEFNFIYYIYPFLRSFSFRFSWPTFFSYHNILHHRHYSYFIEFIRYPRIYSTILTTKTKIKFQNKEENIFPNYHHIYPTLCSSSYFFLFYLSLRIVELCRIFFSYFYFTIFFPFQMYFLFLSFF